MFAKGFYVYIITNKRNGTLYIGHTDNIEKRMDEHRRGIFEGFSKKYGLKHLVWVERHDARQDAFRRERQMKAWKRQWKLDLIEEHNPEWQDLMDPKSSLG